MNRSKISRSFLVAIFVVSIIFLGYLSISIMMSGVNNTIGVHTKLAKVGYAIALIILVPLYMIIKDKLYRMKIKRGHSLIFRYIFLAIIAVIASSLCLTKDIQSIPTVNLIVYLTVNVIIAFIIKKIIFNVSKSDLLSVLGMVAYVMLPNIIQDQFIGFNSLFLCLFVTLSILLLQLLIDELKQRGIRTRKYIIEAIILGVCIGITTLLGMNIFIWLILIAVLLLITVNLDITHINFPKKMMSNVTQEKREQLYRIERINISKLLLSILIVSVITCGIYFGGKFVIKNYKIATNNAFATNLLNNIEMNRISNITISKTNINERLHDFSSYSTTYYLILYVYILFVEGLAFVLKRRYDTKSTVMKAIFLLALVAVAITRVNLMIYQSLFTIILILIAIVNTSNIYLNREERIKMLVA
ncbi:MAG: hypothetical protein PHP54_05945 [Clostridia bacterium]|nr:hypothetical protein [Clostridia bacterium]